MKTESFVTLEVGRKYLSRDGKVVKIKTDDECGSYPFNGDNHCSYAPDGRWIISRVSNFDLISRIVEPTTLTIQLWGVLWRSKDGKIERLALLDGNPKMYPTRSVARYAKRTVKAPNWKSSKVVKVKCTYEVIE